VTTVRLNIRRDQPSTRAAVVQTVPVGTKLDHVDWTDSGEPINGNPLWYLDANGNYFWSGGVRSEAAEV
jgi:hypothetical protein